MSEFSGTTGRNHPGGKKSGPFSMVAKTVAGLELLLAEELALLGAEDIEVLHRAVSFRGDKRMMYKANYELRTALRVLKPFHQFRAQSEEQLYRQIKSMDWSSLLKVNQTFAIDTVLVQSEFHHSQFISQKAKDAIVDGFREQTGRRPSVDLDRPDLRIHLHITGDQCDVSLDSSGSSLHKRGYRVMQHDAPLNEVLAAGIIALSGWDKKSNFIDFMCGSGTLLVEALMAACNIPAGFYRDDFGFFHWNDFDVALWEEVKQEAALKRSMETDFQVIGNDHSRKSLYQARENLEHAGLEKKVQLFQGDFSKLQPPSSGGIVITNPPYGERITVEDIIALYQEMGNIFKRKYAGYSAWVVSSDMRALKMIGLKPKKKYLVYNGPLECRLYGFELYEGSKRTSDDT